MYFLDQIKNQFLKNIVAYSDLDNVAEPVNPTEGEASNDNALKAPEQQLFQELNEQLDAIDNDSKFVSGYCSVIGKFLEKVRNEEIEGLSSDDSDFVHLLNIYQHKFDELKGLRDEGQEIERVIARHMHTLDETVNRAVAGDNIDERLERAFEESGMLTEEESAELERLEIKFSGLREAISMKLKNYLGQEENLTPNMNDVISQYKRLDTTSLLEKTDKEKLDYFQSGAINDLEEIHRLADIALRDESIVGENGEKLGTERIESTHEAYNEILENEEIKEALTSADGKIPTFEELEMNHIHILQEKGVSLAELFLVDEKGQGISGNIENGKTYIVNFSSNKHLSGKMDFAFIANNIQEINVDGEKLTFVENSFKLDGKNYHMKDGSKVEIIANFEDADTPEREERHEKINDLLEQHSIANTHQRMISEAMLSDDPQSTFEGMTLPGGLIGSILMFIMKMLTQKEFEYDSTEKLWKEVDKTNAEIMDEGFGQYYDNGVRIDINSDMESLPAGVRGLVSTIYQAEASSDPNKIYGGSPIQPEKPITEMTLREVRNFQDRMVAAGSISSAIGAPQIIRKTMDGAISAGVFGWNDKFDVEAQNRFTLWKMEQRGLSDFTSGKISNMTFLKNLSMEWASLPKDMSGAGYYDGHAGNKALVSPQQLLRHIDAIGRG